MDLATVTPWEDAMRKPITLGAAILLAACVGDEGFDLASASPFCQQVMPAVDAFMAKSTPPGVSIHLTGDSTTLIASRLSVLKRNLLVGIVLVFLVLWMVIGVRNSLLAIVGVPFSFLCAFLFMYGIDVSINAVSVFSLVLVSGIVVAASSSNQTI